MNEILTKSEINQFNKDGAIFLKGKIDIIDYKGNMHSYGHGDLYCKVRFTNKSIERKLFRNPSLYLGEGYMNEEIIIERAIDEETGEELKVNNNLISDVDTHPDPKIIKITTKENRKFGVELELYA